MTVKITRLELTPLDLRREAARTKETDAARRMLAIALLLEGNGRSRRRASRVWIAKRCEIGFTATTVRVSAVCSTARTAVVHRVS